MELCMKGTDNTLAEKAGDHAVQMIASHRNCYRMGTMPPGQKIKVLNLAPVKGTRQAAGNNPNGGSHMWGQQTELLLVAAAVASSPLLNAS